ncbi:inner membrane magnesium transporter-like protein mrs2 [Plenodomus tracheiphilus IPT5]|uniref:Magnesium transporter n=1 Tax=Plenodomus tracheiphilus IPT5 TaxID=1408161 RepID=A0A6A7AZY3_9PLEO|nr:inner membrane magnesium transporter-like protein mrs2 [Plenodomus tracheiphilus IPT5]
MRPTLAHRIAPSPLVLNFLRAQVRSAFESPTTQCAGLRRHQRGYETYGRGACVLDRRTKSEDLGSSRGSGIVTGSGFVTARCPLEKKAFRPALDSSQASVRQRTFLTTRNFATTSRNQAWNPFSSTKARRLAAPTPPPDEPSASASGFGSSLGRMTRATNELKMRCTELDEHGNVTLVSGEFKKSELIAKYGLLPRDLRKIDSSLLPHILVRPTAILINLLNLRVLLKHNRVLVFDAYGTTDSKSQSVFMYDLDLKLRQKESAANGTLAYEFRALEAVLISVTLSLEKEFEGVSEPVVRVLRELEEDIDRDKLRYLLIYSKKLGSFEQKARLVRNALEELLEADDDLSAMYLTEKAEGKTREDEDHTEVEMLLESYHKVADEIVQAAENLVSSIRNTEEIVKAILDANRNSLMLLDLKFSISTLSITAGTFVAALYGMNLKNFIEESDFGFYGISAWCTVFGVIVAAYGLTKLRKVQRVSMYGHGPGALVSREPPKVNSWGLGAWGGGSRNGVSRGDYGHMGPLGGAPDLNGVGKRGENLADVMQRERAQARKLAKVEARVEDAGK